MTILGDIPHATLAQLIERHEVLLLDAYGVLIAGEIAVPGARDGLDAIRAAGRRFLVLTNDAARLPETCAAKYERLGLGAVDPDDIVTAGSLLTPYFAEHGLAGARCAVLGTADSRRYVQRAGGELVELPDDADAVVICDEAGYDVLETLHRAVTMLFGRLDRGEEVHLISPNPDLVFPRGPAGYGITAGALAATVEAVLRHRYPHRDDLTFARLGKPHAPIFHQALRRAGTRDAVMIGDQLGTDILGATRAGLPSALVLGGVTAWEPERVLGQAAPTWVLASLDTSPRTRTRTHAH